MLTEGFDYTLRRPPAPTAPSSGSPRLFAVAVILARPMARPRRPRRSRREHLHRPRVHRTCRCSMAANPAPRRDRRSQRDRASLRSTVAGGFTHDDHRRRSSPPSARSASPVALAHRVHRTRPIQRCRQRRRACSVKLGIIEHRPQRPRPRRHGPRRARRRSMTSPSPKPPPSPNCAPTTRREHAASLYTRGSESDATTSPPPSTPLALAYAGAALPDPHPLLDQRPQPRRRRQRRAHRRPRSSAPSSAASAVVCAVPYRHRARRPRRHRHPPTTSPPRTRAEPRREPPPVEHVLEPRDPDTFWPTR